MNLDLLWKQDFSYKTVIEKLINFKHHFCNINCDNLSFFPPKTMPFLFLTHNTIVVSFSFSSESDFVCLFIGALYNHANCDVPSNWPPVSAKSFGQIVI
jgi:hypothetical protein